MTATQRSLEGVVYCKSVTPHRPGGPSG